MSDERVDPVILGVVKRALRSSAIYHARESGAPEDWIESLNELDDFTVYNVVSICFGEPGAKEGVE